jgi:hypothetical protein
MNFKRFKALARKVFPDLPPQFDQLPDKIKIYHYLIPWLIPEPPINESNLTDSQRVDLFSLNNMVMTQIRNHKIAGESVWDE